MDYSKDALFPEKSLWQMQQNILMMFNCDNANYGASGKRLVLMMVSSA